jgi:hypothetical protein
MTGQTTIIVGDVSEKLAGLALRPATFCDPHGADAGPLFEGKT